DGKIPYVSDAAREGAGNAVNARTSGRRPFDGPEAMGLYDRCITRGFPHVIFPTIYDNTSQIVQGPGYVAIRYEMIHDARVIPLDNRPHLSPSIRSYFGDSRGHWEGDTLVVDVPNFAKHAGYRCATANLHAVERETGAAGIAGARCIDSVEPFEHPRQVLVGNSRALVRYRQRHQSIHARRVHADERMLRRIADRVGDQVPERIVQLGRIAVQR